jgi:hypothetical protein
MSHASTIFSILHVKADNEFIPQNRPLEDELELEMKFAAAQANIPLAERKIRLVEECGRAAFYGRTYKDIPQFLPIMLGREITKQINYFHLTIQLNP